MKEQIKQEYPYEVWVVWNSDYPDEGSVVYPADFAQTETEVLVRANTALVGNIDAIDGGFDVAMLMRSKLTCGELERLENRKPYIVAVGQRIE